MTKEEILACLMKKKEYVEKYVKPALVQAKVSVVDVQYCLFQSKEYGYVDEVVVVEFVGGAKRVRNCSGDSLSAILEEASHLAAMCSYNYSCDDVTYYHTHLTDAWRLL